LRYRRRRPVFERLDHEMYQYMIQGNMSIELYRSVIQRARPSFGG
jgi:hypothetical protein